MDAPSAQAWLEYPDGRKIILTETCTLGRSTSCKAVLMDKKVSRRHALIHKQGNHEFWLVDQGSSNGSYVNDRRVAQPTKLSDGDRLGIGNVTLVFRQKSASEDNPATEFSDRTVIQIRAQPCWLLLADIVGSSALAQELSPEAFASTIGAWFADSKKRIEASHGLINKYLGDGFLAYWPQQHTPLATVVGLLTELRESQAAGRPNFRIVLHYGKVTMGGGPSLGEESLSGPEVNFIFRMEKVAAALRRNFMLSAAAANLLRESLDLESLGQHPVQSFEGVHEMFGIAT